MMTKKTDLRKLRTRKLLRQALVELMQEKGLEKITVSDLTMRAEINRGTFYLHYKDVTDLLQQCQQQLMDELSLLANEIQIDELLKAAKRDEPYEKIVAILEFWYEHTDFSKLMLGPKGDPAFAMGIRKFMQQKLFNKLTDFIPEDQAANIKVPKDYLIAFISSANVGVLQHWFESGQHQSPRELALIMTRLIAQGPVKVSCIHE